MRLLILQQLLQAHGGPKAHLLQFLNGTHGGGDSDHGPAGFAQTAMQFLERGRLPGMDTLLTEEDVAKQLHVSVASLRRWRLERRGPQFIKVGSLVRYRPEELEAWLAAQPTGGASPAAPRRVHLSAAK